MEVISLVVSPSLFSAEASSFTVDAPGGSSSSSGSKRPTSSMSSAFSPWITSVAPCEKGSGWLTPVVGFKKIVMLLLLTATGEIQHFVWQQ